MKIEKCINLPKTKIFLYKDKKIKKRNDKFLDLPKNLKKKN